VPTLRVGSIVKREFCFRIKLAIRLFTEALATLYEYLNYWSAKLKVPTSVTGSKSVRGCLVNSASPAARVFLGYLSKEKGGNTGIQR